MSAVISWRFPNLWQRLAAWFRRRKSKADAAPDAAVTFVTSRAPEESPPAVEPAAVETDPAQSKDAWMRFYEKQRRKHDKFVTPKGELPERTPRPRAATQEVKPRTPKPQDPTELLPESESTLPFIVEPHHEDQQKVLFKIEEALGEFNFRDTILEQLDRYFFYLRRMKKRDADAYHLYRQVGASLLPYLANGSYHREAVKPIVPQKQLPLPTKFNQLRPTFGCFAYGADPEAEKFEKTQDHGKWTGWVPKFMYYQKYKMPPATVQPVARGDVYMLTIWWDRPDTYTHNKYGSPQQIPIYIAADGNTVTPLKVIETRWTHVKRYDKKPGSHYGPVNIPQRAWKYPKDYIRWAKENDDTIEHFLTQIFLDSITLAENSHMSMTRIAVTKSNMTAVFSVNINRTSYFFQDRDISVTEAGTRKPIFHLVKPHVRKDGTAVKMHFRGLREFTWAGYQVHISIPGLDHLDINDLDIGVLDEEFIEDRSKAWNTRKLGAFLAGQMNKGRAA